MLTTPQLIHQVEALTNLTPTTVRLPNLRVVRTNTPLLYSDARVATPASGGARDGAAGVESAKETPQLGELLGVAVGAVGYEDGAAAVTTHENVETVARNIARNKIEGAPQRNQHERRKQKKECKPNGQRNFHQPGKTPSMVSSVWIVS